MCVCECVSVCVCAFVRVSVSVCAHVCVSVSVCLARRWGFRTDAALLSIIVSESSGVSLFAAAVVVT